MAPLPRLLVRCLAGGLAAGLGFSTVAAFADHQFSDVADSSAFHDDVAWLTDNGIVTGFPDGTFRPQDPVKRQQLARWLHNYNGTFQTVVNQIDPPAGTSVTVTVTCPTGSRALMGTGSVEPGLDLTLAESHSEDVDQWLVRFDAPGNATIDAGLAEAVALCGPI